MSERKDIIEYNPSNNYKYGLVYTKKCGWIDLGHAQPTGAAKLWSDILSLPNEKYIAQELKPKFSYFQYMEKFKFKGEFRKWYSLKDNLSFPQKQSVALSIFMEVSMGFETLQSGLPYRLFSDSGFSSEDLVSNLVGFYRALFPMRNYILLCEPSTKEYSEKIWDTCGAVGSNKNYVFGAFLYDIDPKTGKGAGRCEPLPYFLDTIKPAKKGDLFYEVSGYEKNENLISGGSILKINPRKIK